MIAFKAKLELFDVKYLAISHMALDVAAALMEDVVGDEWHRREMGGRRALHGGAVAHAANCVYLSSFVQSTKSVLLHRHGAQLV